MVSRSSVHDDCGCPWEPHTLHGTSSPPLLFLCILLTFKGHHLCVWKIVCIEIISFELSWLDHFKTILALEKWLKRLRRLMLLQRPWLPFLVSTLDSSWPLYFWLLGTWHPLLASLSTVHMRSTYRGSWHIHRRTRKDKCNNFKNQWKQPWCQDVLRSLYNADASVTSLLHVKVFPSHPLPHLPTDEPSQSPQSRCCVLNLSRTNLQQQEEEAHL